ncbi:hypothetical protein IFM89_018473 [Coptis chinensis]|uniref:protein-serine/threonine phosphatase n=1 Tax=Coptis chinensis TaxID=261450 RepID=A0A835H7A5_9MAGN|nr:hypothetical protein IFM89_018473 [Coptis chinensis]
MRKAQTSVSTGVNKLSIHLTQIREPRSCQWKPAVEGEEGNLKSRYDIGRVDGLLCHKDLGDDNKVESPMTVTRANNLLEDQSQVESGPLSLEFSASMSAQRLETEPAKPSEIESTKMFEILPAQPSGIELAKRSEIESALVFEAEPAQPSNTESPSRHRLAQPSEIESAQSSHSMSHVSITESDQPSKTKSAMHSEIESVQSSHDMSQISTNERLDKDAAVPTFGEWDETNPASDDGFTVIFNKIREEKLTGSTNAVAERDEQFYSVEHKQDNNNSTRSNWNCAWMREAKTSVSSGIKKKIIPCCMLAEGYYSNSRYSSGRVDKLLWSMDLGHHFNGEFSMAVTQANNLLEDQSQVESGPLGSMNSSPRGTFVGIYDGHGGPEAARFINDHLFNNLKSNDNPSRLFGPECDGAESTSNHRNMSVDVIREAYSATEEEFLCLVQKEWLIKPQMAAVGSCCLVGIVCAGTLYIANVGNSRVVLGRSEKASMDVTAIQLSTEHDASIESIREELNHCILMIHR